MTFEKKCFFGEIEFFGSATDLTRYAKRKFGGDYKENRKFLW
jgi:hypothetical protein